MTDKPKNKYLRPITPRMIRNGGFDVYDIVAGYRKVCPALNCPALAHAVKKIIFPGERGAKGLIQDLEEAAWSLREAIQLLKDEEAVPLDIPAPIPIEHREQCSICYNPRRDDPNGKH